MNAAGLFNAGRRISLILLISSFRKGQVPSSAHLLRPGLHGIISLSLPRRQLITSAKSLLLCHVTQSNHRRDPSCSRSYPHYTHKKEGKKNFGGHLNILPVTRHIAKRGPKCQALVPIKQLAVNDHFKINSEFLEVRVNDWGGVWWKLLPNGLWLMGLSNIL